ncbi:PAP2 family protein, partial|nr:PAP2 family protein [Escherichia coli]
RGMTLASAYLIAFTVPVAVLHVLAAGLGLPFVDGALARFEAGLGFDWTAHVAFLGRHPTLSWWLALAYHSSGPQVGIVVIALSATRRLGRLFAYTRLFSVTLLCVIGIAALFPALGPYATYA